LTEAFVMTLAQKAITMALILAGPVMLVSLLVGSLISLVQAATQINEPTLSFVPKMIGIIAVLVGSRSWMLQQSLVVTSELVKSLPNLTH